VVHHPVVVVAVVGFHQHSAGTFLPYLVEEEVH
jgi:hypothetical protein